MRDRMVLRMRVVVVPAARAEDVRRELHARGLIDRSVKIRKRDGEVHIPLLADPPTDMPLQGGHVVSMGDFEPLRRQRDPRVLLRERFAADGIPEEFVPRRWARIGEAVILRLPAEARGRAAAIARAIGETLDAKTVVEDVSGIHGPLRIPEIRVLWGDGTETVHVEGGVRYKIDVARVMFSSGNLGERMSIVRRVSPGDVVVDLFAGIGYFALPIALRARPAAVYACEVNPTAFHYLLENVALNRADCVVSFLGDCRETAPRDVADWVLMGHFEAVEYLDVALECLRGGGTIVVHGLVPAEGFPAALVARVRSEIEGLGGSIRRVAARKVKSFAPGIVHGVVEVDTMAVPKGLSGVTPSGAR